MANADVDIIIHYCICFICVTSACLVPSGARPGIGRCNHDIYRHRPAPVRSVTTQEQNDENYLVPR